MKHLLLPLFLLFFMACDGTVTSDQVDSNDDIYQSYLVNYNQTNRSLYAEAQFRRARCRECLFNYFDYIKLVGEDKIQFSIFDKEELSYDLTPTQLRMDRRQNFFGSKAVPYYFLKDKVTVDSIKEKTMSFRWYNSKESKTYSYQLEILVPNLVSISHGDNALFNTNSLDEIVLTFDESIEDFDTVNLELINKEGNSFHFEVAGNDNHQFVISGLDLRRQALDQSVTKRQNKKKKIGNLTIKSKKTKDVPLLLDGTHTYKMNISARRVLTEKELEDSGAHMVDLIQNIKVNEQNLRIEF